MPNKTIYVSDNDLSLFEEAKEIAGEALSSVIATALKEYIARNKSISQGMKELSLSVGPAAAEREVRFVGKKMQDWSGFSDDKKWWMSGTIYRTQKGNWALYLTTVCKASLLTDKKAWKESGDYLTNPRSAELLTGSTISEFQGRIPEDLARLFLSLLEKDEKPIEYLDI